MELSPPLNPILVTDEKSLQDVARFMDTEPIYCLDTETNVVEHFYERRIRTIQIGNRDVQYVIDLLAFVPNLIVTQGHRKPDPMLRPVVEALKPGLDSNKHLKIGHNLVFDYVVLLWCLGIQAWNFHDTMLAEQTIHAGEVPFTTPGYWGLDHLALRYFGLHMDDRQGGFANIHAPMTQEMLEYAALDVRVPLAIYRKQMIEIQKHGLETAVRIDADAIPPIGDAHVRGFFLDRESWNERGKEALLAINKSIQELDKYFIPIVGRKPEPPSIDLEKLETDWRSFAPKSAEAKTAAKAFKEAKTALKKYNNLVETFQGEAAINYNSTPQLKKAFAKAGILLTSTDEKVLLKMKNVPMVKALLDYRKATKIKTTYGETFLEQYIHPKTGRIHSDINLYGAETGRTASKNPNLQNIPNGKEWRACFKAAPGCKIATLDYNGQELRIIAQITKDPVWITALNNNWDLHSVCAEMLDREEWEQATEPGCEYYANHEKCSCKVHKKLRKKLKTTNFGIPYGMSEKALSEALEISAEEAKEILEKYSQKFSRTVQGLAELGAYAKANFEARTLSGRRRIINAPTADVFEKRFQERLQKYRQPRQDSSRKERDQAMKAWQKRVEAAHEAALKGADPCATKFCYNLNNVWEKALKYDSWFTDQDRKLINKAQWGTRYSFLGKIEREGKNTPVQGTGADMMKRAIGCGFDADDKPYLWHELRKREAWIVNTVHDELVIEFRNGEEQIVEIANDCMVRAGAEFIKVVPVVVDRAIGPHWIKD